MEHEVIPNITETSVKENTERQITDTEKLNKDDEIFILLNEQADILTTLRIEIGNALVENIYSATETNIAKVIEALPQRLYDSTNNYIRNNPIGNEEAEKIRLCVRNFVRQLTNYLFEKGTDIYSNKIKTEQK
jgi:hypothetical protein